MITNYLVSANLGIMIFFSVAVAPGIFKHLPQEWAGVYVRKFFPKYYFFLGLVSLVAAFLTPTLVVRSLLLIVSALFFFTLWVITPMVNKARDEQKQTTFHVLHTASVVINFIQMGLFFYVLMG
ncbi:MAG: hypothetical protein B7Z60_08925 [Ferrovum sp. 37-45-19]|nr:MAG: hypothetical protein B7Z65_09130 [Ferrovum sp. 21-44-67]OYV93355.1 MAG: hypothetical protein B7Z60_08925 [Ferrovum sp. 37-45-19]OZB32127.1 MAG: hypothetical protein B7X47_07475 [Ferrovum sp. 34-44-207]HQT82285.1 DUF4149 domain-containing protein [Ferrovaceae bacterium]HQU07233.1 DUF4149 domain-containing protein [Ferrovaceae bacterium]